MGHLTVAKVRRTVTPGRYADGGTLYLHIAPGGSKSWVQRITVRGRRRDLGLGAWPVVSLAEARTRALANRVLVERGGDPLASKRKAVPTFREASQRTYEANRPRWRSAKVAAVWMQRAERHAFPKLGDLRVDAIGREEVLRVLTPIWTAKPETARKVRAIIRSTPAWAEAHGHVERNMAGDAIDGALPAQPAVQVHFRTVPHADVAAALAAVEASGAVAATKLCFRFLVLTAARSGEAREAVWSEVDLEARTWTDPAERMKSNREHVVPLSDGALAVLAATAELREAGSDLVFPRREARPSAVRCDALQAAEGNRRAGGAARLPGGVPDLGERTDRRATGGHGARAGACQRVAGRAGLRVERSSRQAARADAALSRVRHGRSR